MIIIRYCDYCEGKPYYDLKKDSSHAICPYCHHSLKKAVYYDDSILKNEHISMERYSPTQNSIKKDNHNKSVHEEERIAIVKPAEDAYIANELDSRIGRMNYNTQKAEESTNTLQSNCINNKIEPKSVNNLIKESGNTNREIKERRHAREFDVKEVNYTKVTNDNNSSIKKNDANLDNDLHQERIVADNRHKVQGKIISVRTDDKFHRTLMQKIIEKIRFGQRMSDIENTINIVLTTDEGFEKTLNGIRQETSIVMHGAIRGGLDGSLAQSKIIADGNYNDKLNKEFYAKNIYISGTHKQVEVENSDVLIFAVPLMIIMMIIFLFTLIPDGMSMKEALVYSKNRIVTFLGIDFFLSILSTSIIYFRTRRRLMQMVRGLRPLRFRTCLASGVAVSTVLSILIMFII